MKLLNQRKEQTQGKMVMNNIKLSFRIRRQEKTVRRLKAVSDAYEEEGNQLQLTSQREMEGRSQKVVSYFTKDRQGIVRL